MYFDDNQLSTEYDEYHLVMNNLNIIIIGIGKCYNLYEGTVGGVFVNIKTHTKNISITISNSLFKGVHNTAVYIKSICANKHMFLLHNCIFYSVISKNEPVVHASLLEYNRRISFSNCTFQYNHAHQSIISIQITIKKDLVCRSIIRNQLKTLSMIYFRGGQFKSNNGKILSLISFNKEIMLFIVGPTIITHNSVQAKYTADLISVQNTIIYIYGPVVISYNSVKRHNILILKSSEVTFYNMISFKRNLCEQIISFSIQQPYIQVMEYANITFIDNKVSNRLIELQGGYSRYNYCLFQYMKSSNKSTITPNSFTITVIKTLTVQQKECSYTYYQFKANYQWLSTAAFHGYDSETVNHKIIQIDDQKINYHRICLCNNNGSYDCSKDMLGTVYPGQVLQIGLCTPCNNNTFILYVETYHSLQTNLSCRITNQAEILNTISNYNKTH